MNKLLRELLAISTESRHCENMIEFIKKVHPEAEEDSVGNLYITKGTGPYPAIVAHMDTVHSIKDEIIPFEHGGVVIGINPTTMKQTGIGGDDKCGIYAGLVLLRHLSSVKVAFFVDEEIGCVGAQACNLEFFKDCKFILEADRRGDSDFVNDISGPISSKAFQKAISGIITKHGFKFCHGMMTDVMKLRDRKVGISCANMSAGYHRPHSDSEYISIPQLDNTIHMMWEICINLTLIYPFVAKEKKWVTYYQRPPVSGPYIPWHQQQQNREDYADYWEHFGVDPKNKAAKKPRIKWNDKTRKHDLVEKYDEVTKTWIPVEGKTAKFNTSTNDWDIIDAEAVEEKKPVFHKFFKGEANGEKKEETQLAKVDGAAYEVQ